jgi:hypothetical protein
MIEECERWAQAKLVAPSTYKRISVTVGIPDEKTQRQDVFISYDAANSYGTPIRQLEHCQFPYGPNEAKIRPLTQYERKAIAQTGDEDAASALDLELGKSEPECCMPASTPTAPPEPTPPPKPAAEPKPAKAAAPRAEPAAAVEKAAPPDLCWQDYCPFEPPQGGPDKGICRQLRAGIAVDDQMMSAGAMMRDARAQMDDFKAEHGEF